MITVNEQAANGKSTGSSLDSPGRYVPHKQVRLEPTNERDQPVAVTPAVAAQSSSENWEKEIKEAAALDAEEISQRLNVDLR